jgi:hypothetical protein
MNETHSQQENPAEAKLAKQITDEKADLSTIPDESLRRRMAWAYGLTAASNTINPFSNEPREIDKLLETALERFRILMDDPQAVFTEAEIAEARKKLDPSFTLTKGE